MKNYNATLQSNNTDLQEILNTINALPDASGTTLPVLTKPANASELLNGKELIDGEGNIITGSMPNNGAIAMTMDGIDTKTVSIPEGYTSGGTVSLDGTIDEEVEEQTDLIAQIKTAANNLPEAGGSEPVLQSKTVTPAANSQTIIADSGYDGLSEVVVDGDENLVPENIISGVSIFGVTGSASGGGAPMIKITTESMDITMNYFDADMNHQQASGYAAVETYGGIIWFIDGYGGMSCSGEYTEVFSGSTDTEMYVIHGDSTIEYW